MQLTLALQLQIIAYPWIVIYIIDTRLPLRQIDLGGLRLTPGVLWQFVNRVRVIIPFYLQIINHQENPKKIWDEADNGLPLDTLAMFNKDCYDYPLGEMQ